MMARVAHPLRSILVVVQVPWVQPRYQEIPATLRADIQQHETGGVWEQGRRLLVSVGAYRVWRKVQPEYLARVMARMAWRDGRDYWHAVTCGGRLIGGTGRAPQAAKDRGKAAATPMRAVSPASVRVRGCGGCARQRRAKEAASA